MLNYRRFIFSVFFFFFKGKILTSCTVLGKFSQLGNITEQIDQLESVDRQLSLR